MFIYESSHLPVISNQESIRKTDGDDVLIDKFEVLFSNENKTIRNVQTP